MPKDYFGERVADRYDQWDAVSFVAAVGDPIVDFLVDVAGQSAALELGIGAGRIALRWRSTASACKASTSRRQWS